MLGYKLEDLNKMIDATYLALNYLPPAQTDLADNLAKANDFLQGLWAEGYFEQPEPDQ